MGEMLSSVGSCWLEEVSDFSALITGVLGTTENTEALSMLLSPGNFFEQNKHHWTVEKIVDVQIRLVRLELSQDVYGIPRFLWNDTVVFLIFSLQ